MIKTMINNSAVDLYMHLGQGRTKAKIANKTYISLTKMV